MPPKQKIAAPIDRPLSRAYLREFTGWSTAYPPGMSDPTSLRVMENLMVNRDGSLRIRPGLRYLSYTVPPDDTVDGTSIDVECVGTHEAFYLNDGTKAYLFAVREADRSVGFRVLRLDADASTVHQLTDDGIGFDVPATGLNFTEATTYVKYLQIDNTIYALSNAGETMRIFNVGVDKKARVPYAIIRPDWTVADKLTIVQPDEAWITAGEPVATRYNLVLNPSAEVSTTNLRYFGGFYRSPSVASSGSQSVRVTSEPQRRNLMPQPLHDVAATGDGAWYPGYWATGLSTSGDYVRCASDTGVTGRNFYMHSPKVDVKAGNVYSVGWDWGDSATITDPELVLIWYSSSDAEVGERSVHGFNNTVARKNRTGITAPAGAVSCRIIFRAKTDRSGSPCYFYVRNVVVVPNGESTSMFHGGSGVDYYWEGAVNNSPSVYHPPGNVTEWAATSEVTAGETYTAQVKVRGNDVAREAEVYLDWINSRSAVVGVSAAAPVVDSTGAWTTITLTAVAPADAVRAELRTSYQDVARGEFHYIDDRMLEKAASAGSFFFGGTADSSTFKRRWTAGVEESVSEETEYAVAATIPAAETKTADTLISMTKSANQYNFAYFYTISNEVGESAPSRVTQVRAQRRQSAWAWETPNAAGEPSGTDTNDPAKTADQLVAIMPEDVYDAAKAAGATHWSAYVLTWSDQDVVPVEGVRLGTQEISTDGDYGSQGWIRHTPQGPDAGSTALVPKQGNPRINYSDPTKGGQGIVASDRMVVVYDPTDAAVIRWTSNRMGEYSNFTASAGGGYKTLTSGNLYVPAAVKLWQNPESKDTLTILCMGTDGQSAAYYMAPAQVASQSDATNIMAFEETTATPGTTSPYGCEVLNNALYHPLETELMKSTASNYNINHKAMTDDIANMWRSLQDKHKIVSSQLDNRLYYLVNNPSGAALAPGHFGNEVWVYDAAAEAGSWSRWTVGGISLRKIEMGGRLVMSIVKNDGIYCFDELKTTDDAAFGTSKPVSRNWAIYWYLETNTQGANRAHDAWAHLQQVSLTLGNFQGRMTWGIRSWDLNGKAVEVKKTTQDFEDPEGLGLPWDFTDHLLVRRDLMEWRFFARSSDPIDGFTPHSSGQLNLVQYRYTPVSVNVGYEYGSVETFQYARNVAVGNDTLSVNGVPVPHVETRRP